MLGTLLADFGARAAGVANLHDNAITRFPIVKTDHPLSGTFVHRTLRLNCLTQEFAVLWDVLASRTWEDDEFTDTRAIASIASPPTRWDRAVPVRGDLDRWLLLTELDALGALILGVDPEGLTAVYRAQFPVLLGYEYQTVFDAHGRQLCGDWHQYGYLQAQLEAAGKATRGWVKLWDRVQAYRAGDTEVDLGPFEPPFRPADREAAMTGAYWAFVDRYGLTPPNGAERPA
jgi:hypothetical protein